MYVWLSPFAVHLKPSQHCQLAIPQYKVFLVVFFFKNNPIQNTILHLVVMSLLGCDLVFDDFDSFAESWSALL